MAVVPTLLKGLEWRCIGPHRGGRASAVAGHPTKPMVFYFGACNGGVWRTEDGGTFWENVSDGFFGTAAVGAIAVAESDPNVIYVGTGESCIRNDVSSGDGVYKSTDGGKTWRHVGLADSRHIGEIRVNPADPDLVYVAALGHAWGPNEERGVFRSTDGGATWERVLFRSPKAGAVDLAMDRTNPRVLYAAVWEVYRNPWTIASGGEDSGLFKSTDGGDTWVELTGNPGLPGGLKGRIGVTVSPARPDRVWAVVEAERGGLYRSEDGGGSWEQVNDTDGRGRPWYHSHVVADPQAPETVWLMDLLLVKSVDGGATFTPIPAPHADHHALWIDPRDPQRMINGNDGGAAVTFNGGRSWSTVYNQPTAQIYHLDVDSRHPYRVYGTQQDNSAISVPSRTEKGYVPFGDCYVTGMSESGHIAVRPDNPDIVFSGSVGSVFPSGIGDLYRADHASANHGELRTVWPEEFYGWPPSEQKYRFQWTYPIVISPHDPGVLYVAGNHVFRSADEGRSWEVISPDLTRNDPGKQENPGGPITVQGVTGADNYCTVFALAESPHESGVLWAGSDDGVIHLYRDGGQAWNDVTPPDLPEWSTVAVIEPSRHDPATAYVAAYRYKLDDYRPLLFKTTDYGQTWQQITGGIPDNDFTRVIREDPVRPGLLYAGSETGLYASVDDGESWRRFGRDSTPERCLPVVPVYDLKVKDDDLVVATHGRSFWILDDITPLRQLTDQLAGVSARLFAPRRTSQDIAAPAFALPAAPGWRDYQMELIGATFYQKQRPDGSTYRTYLDAGDNPPRGVLVRYLLADQPQGEVTLSFLDADGNEIRRFASKHEHASPSTPDVVAEEGEATGAAAPGQHVPAEPGLNCFVWDMRYPAPTPLPDDPAANWPAPYRGPEAPPGTYQVRLTVNGDTHTETFQIAKDSRVPASQDEIQERFTLLTGIRDRISAAHEAILRIRAIREQVEDWARRAHDQADVREAAWRLQHELSTVEEELVQTKIRSFLDVTKHPAKLNAKFRSLGHVVATALGAPTRQSYEVFHDLSARLDAQLQRLNEIVDTDVPAFNHLVRQTGVPAIVLPGGNEK